MSEVTVYFIDDCEPQNGNTPETGRIAESLPTKRTAGNNATDQDPLPPGDGRARGRLRAWLCGEGSLTPAWLRVTSPDLTFKKRQK